MNLERSIFASMSTQKFVEHLERNGITPTALELNSTPTVPGVIMTESIANSILEVTGQRSGDPISGESSAK